jgi:hypothetical protein
MALLNGEGLREAAKRKRSVEVEISAGTVRLRSWGLGEALEWDKRNEGLTEGEIAALLPEFVAKSWIGEDGESLMPLDEGIEVARNLDQHDLLRLAAAVKGLLARSEESVKDAEKNSEASRSESTSTGSLDNSGTPTST